MHHADAQYEGPTRFRDRLEGTEGKLLAAAFDCILEAGLAGTTTRAITDRAGLLRGILHYYFRSKEDLLLRLLSVLFDNFTTNIDRVAQLDLPPVPKIDLVLDSGLSLLGPRSDEFVVLINLWGSALAEGGESQRVFQELHGRFRSAIAHVVRAGEQEGVFREGSSRTMPLLIVALVQGAALQYVINEKAGDITDIRASIKELVNTIRTQG